MCAETLVLCVVCAGAGLLGVTVNRTETLTYTKGWSTMWVSMCLLGH